MHDPNESTVSMRPGNKWPWEKLVKIAVMAILFGVSVFLMVTQDWIGTTKQGAVDTVRVDQVEKQVGEIRAEYVRKDVLEPRLGALEKRVDEILDQQKDNSRVLQQILLEQRRR